MDIFDKTSAEKKSIGFSYQDYVALKHALELKPDESLGIEVFDDLHLESIHGQKTLIQVKHSINLSNNITNKDIDLWKTLYNWSEAIKIIDDKDVRLVFYTNKPLTQKKGILKLLSMPNINPENIREEIESIYREHKNHEDDLYRYISTIHNLNETLSNRLFHSINFHCSNSEIISQIKTLLKTFSVPDDKIDYTFHSISGAFFEHKYELVKNKNKIVITYDSFRKKLGIDRIIQISRHCINSFDQYYKFESAYPASLDEKVSYKQLHDIKINDKNIIKYMNEMAKTEAFIQRLISDGDLTKQEEELIYDKAFDEWASHHTIKYLTTNYSVICTAHITIASSLYQELISKCDITIDNNKLPRSMITGAFLSLSDKPRIGWFHHWESIYK
ncbi:hypothetical protein [Pectobacterium versatile]|uniref:hypothetical protein n=1 Tax=Pectobacterium versatile TaxID=2488639 RepID=UPI003822ACE7